MVEAGEVCVCAGRGSYGVAQGVMWSTVMEEGGYS